MMSKKAIILKGKKNSGKSTTIKEVCKLLNPTEVKKLNLYLFENWSEDQFKKLCSKFFEDDLEKIFSDEIFNIVEKRDNTIFEDAELKLNDIFLIKVDGKWILVVGGSPSEIKIHIVIIICILIFINIQVSIILTAMRTKEREYNTITGLDNNGYNGQVIEIKKIDGSNFKETEEWKNRVQDIVELINSRVNNKDNP